MTNSDREFLQWIKKTRKDLEIVGTAIAKQAWAVEIVTAGLSGWEKQQRQEKVQHAEAQRRKNGKLTRPAAAKGVPVTQRQADRTSNSSDVVEPVHNVIIEHDRDGFMLVHVENNELPAPLRNRQRLRQLLLALGAKVSRVNMPTNGVIPFKTKAELIEAIEELSGQRISTGNLQNLVQQLRALFIKAHINPNLIESGGGGYRLRLYVEGRIFENVS